MNVAQSVQLLRLPTEVLRRWLGQLKEPHRFYHTLAHVEYMLANIPPLRRDNREFVAAIWLHDIVYDPKASDNEEQSAAQAAVDLEGSGIDIERVQRLITATKGHDLESIRHWSEAQIIHLDLLILSEPAHVYDAYARQIRFEYAHVPSDEYRAGRAAVLRQFLDRPRIYAEMAHHERMARMNLEREIAALEGS